MFSSLDQTFFLGYFLRHFVFLGHILKKNLHRFPLSKALRAQCIINNLETSPESRIIGGAIIHFPEKCRAINPISYIKSDNPSFYIQHGKLDDIVPYLQSVILAEALEAVMGKEKGKLELIENAGHADPFFFTQKNVNKILDFLDKCLK